MICLHYLPQSLLIVGVTVILTTLFSFVTAQRSFTFTTGAESVSKCHRQVQTRNTAGYINPAGGGGGGGPNENTN